MLETDKEKKKKLEDIKTKFQASVGTDRFLIVLEVMIEKMFILCEEDLVEFANSLKVK